MSGIGGIPIPSASVAVALASIAVHAEEAASPSGHPFDLAAISGNLASPGVREYLEELDQLGLLPEKR